MAALISSVMNTKDRVPIYVNACHELGIEVLPPDVNESQVDFAVVERQDPLRPQRREGRGGGRGARAHRRAQRGRPVRVDLGLRRARRPDRSRTSACSRRSSSAARCPGSRKGDARGARAGGRRGGRSSRPTGSPARARSSTSARSRTSKPKHHPPTPTDEFEKNELLRLEKEVLGLYVSEHPLSAIRDQLRRKSDATIGELERRRDGEVVTVGGIVAARAPHDDEARRRDGVPAARGRHRRRRDGRLQLDLREGARALHRPTAS